MKTNIDKKRFGPWALVTGASSGIGKEFVRQLAASGLNVALVARRETLLDEVGQGIAKDFNVEYRTVVADLSQEGFLDKLAKATNDLDIGLVVSNAGTGNPASSSRLIVESWRIFCGSIPWLISISRITSDKGSLDVARVDYCLWELWAQIKVFPIWRTTAVLRHMYRVSARDFTLSSSRWVCM